MCEAEGHDGDRVCRLVQDDEAVVGLLEPEVDRLTEVAAVPQPGLIEPIDQVVPAIGAELLNRTRGETHERPFLNHGPGDGLAYAGANPSRTVSGTGMTALSAEQPLGAAPGP